MKSTAYQSNLRPQRRQSACVCAYTARWSLYRYVAIWRPVENVVLKMHNRQPQAQQGELKSWDALIVRLNCFAAWAMVAYQNCKYIWGCLVVYRPTSRKFWLICHSLEFREFFSPSKRFVWLCHTNYVWETFASKVHSKNTECDPVKIVVGNWRRWTVCLCLFSLYEISQDLACKVQIVNFGAAPSPINTRSTLCYAIQNSMS